MTEFLYRSGNIIKAFKNILICRFSFQTDKITDLREHLYIKQTNKISKFKVKLKWGRAESDKIKRIRVNYH